jgi:hypothetical protein
MTFISSSTPNPLPDFCCNEASRMTRPSGGGLRNEVEQSRLLPMTLAHAALVAAILNEKT